MHVTLTIETDDLSNLSYLFNQPNAATSLNGKLTASIEEKTEQKPEEEPKKQTSKKAVAKKEGTVKEETEETESGNSKKTEEVAETKKEEKPKTIEEVRAAAAKAVNTNPAIRSKIKELLTSLGAAKVPELKPEQYNEFLEKLSKI